MKNKNLVGVLAMGMIALAAFNLNLSIYSTSSAYSTISLSNIEALAQNNNGGEKIEGIEVLTCSTITLIDPITGDKTTIKQKNCSGEGKHACSCP